MGTVDERIAETVERDLRALFDGTLGDPAAVLARLATSRDPAARAWTVALQAAAWLLGMPCGVRPGTEDCEGPTLGVDLSTRRAAAHFAMCAARAAMLAPSLHELEDALASLRTCATSGVDVVPAYAVVLVDAWRAWLTGELLGLAPALVTAEREARAAGDGAALVDLVSLRALLAESEGDVPSMVALARQASRMARAEARPLQEYFAHLVLARARRRSRHPHLALRILGALARVVPASHRERVGWELALAGDVSLAVLEPSGGLGSSGDSPTAAMRDLLDAATIGDRLAFDDAKSQLTARCAPYAPLRSEASDVLTALDERVSLVEAREELVAWCRGSSSLAPTSLHGLCLRAGDASVDVPEAFLLAGSQLPPRRLLGLAHALLEPNDGARLRITKRRQGRVETLVAVLATAGDDGLAPEACFAQTYEFAYDPEIHRGVFDVALTRARAYLEGAGDIVRRDGKLALVLTRPILVPDPRCAAPVHDRILRLLAREGRTNASDAASRAGLSVRAAQAALKALAEDGVCVSEKDGRQLRYVVEDTTFSEATEWLAPRGARLRPAL